MFLRHFGFLVLFASIATGCSCGSSHMRPPLADTGPPPVMGDAGVPGTDTGMYEWPDAAPAADSGTDAGPVITTALRIVFDGPADSAYLRGSQDVVMYRFSLTAYEDVEIRSVPFELAGLTAADYIVGTLGTEYFRDLKIKDADTGVTLMGPTTLSGSPFSDAFIVRAGETRHFNVTMDLANTEDIVNEFYGDGNNRYRVTIGDGTRFFPVDGVRRVSDGSFVEPEAIENNVTIPGNAMTIVDAELLVTRAAVPCLPIAVRNEPLVPTTGIVFTASAANDILIRSVRLTGSSVDLPLNDVVTYCALFQGDTQVGLSAAPDEFGLMRIPGVNVTVPAGSSVSLTVRCTMDSVVDGDFDTWSVGIDFPVDIDAVREDGYSATPTLDDRLRAAAEGTDGCFGQVRQHGEITVATDNLRQSTILVGGTGYWQNLAQFKLSAQY
jgi:hypothetical protein